MVYALQFDKNPVLQLFRRNFFYLYDMKLEKIQNEAAACTLTLGGKGMRVPVEYSYGIINTGNVLYQRSSM